MRGDDGVRGGTGRWPSVGGGGGTTWLVVMTLALMPLTAQAQGISEDARAKFQAAAESLHPPTFADGKTPTRTIWVDGAAGSGGDGSSAAPFRNLAEAEPFATPGTEIRVRGHVISAEGANWSLSFQGTAAAPIWITGEPGAKITSNNYIAALRLDHARYLIVQDLEFERGPDHVVHFSFSSYLLFRRINSHDSNTACLKGSQSDHIYVEDSDFHHAATSPWGSEQSTQVLDFVGVNTGHILRCRIYNGPNVMVMLKGGTSDLLFAFNEVFDQTSSGFGAAVHIGQWTTPEYYQPLDADYEALRVVAYANLIYQVKGAFFAFGGAKDSAAVHNTMFDSPTLDQLVRYLPGSAGSQSGITQSIPRNCRFTGNIVVGGRSDSPMLDANGSWLGAGNSLDHNVWLKPGPTLWWSPLTQETATSTYDQDPQLSPDGVPGNLALVQDAGPTDLADIPFSEYFVEDFTGALVSSPMDIGAYDQGGCSGTWYLDFDRDGFGDPAVSTTDCPPPSGYVANANDCDDGDPDRHPGATEVCDGIDNDCDGAVDENGAGTWYRDQDGDNWGDSGVSQVSCSAPSGFVATGGDCNDGDSQTYPGAPELCDGVDNDCDGDADEGVTSSWYRDLDGDSYGDPDVGLASCEQPAGFVADASDCNDGDPDAYPGAPELCDGTDNNCDGVVDDVDCSVFDVDSDGEINGIELAWLGLAFGQCSANPGAEWWGPIDYDGDGCVDGDDLGLLATHWQCTGECT